MVPFLVSMKHTCTYRIFKEPIGKVLRYTHRSIVLVSITGGMLVVSVSVAGLVTLAAMTQPSLAPEAKHSLLQYVTGKYLQPSNCTVEFDTEPPYYVGDSRVISIRVSRNHHVLIHPGHKFVGKKLL